MHLRGVRRHVGSYTRTGEGKAMSDVLLCAKHGEPMPHCWECYRFGLSAAELNERAAVVRYLHAEGLYEAAYNIERGDHLKETP
jgi:hypothetical protein